MNVSRVAAQNAEIYRQTELKKLDKRHEEQVLEDVVEETEEFDDEEF